MNIRMNLHLQTSQSRQQQQCLMMSTKMQLALELLQLPVLELQAVIDREIEENPLLELEEEPDPSLDLPERFSHQTRGEQELHPLIPYQPTLAEILLTQSQEAFSNDNDLHIATIIIGHLDDRGFLTSSIEEIALLENKDLAQCSKVLKKIQLFDPPGIGVSSLRESWMIQLILKGKKESLAFKIVEKTYDLLLQNKIEEIAKTLKADKNLVIQIIEEEISHLSRNPGYAFSRPDIRPLTPDIIIHIEGATPIIYVNNWALPAVRLNTHYFRMLQEPSLDAETRQYLEKKLLLGRNLLKSLDQRQTTLQRIAICLVNRQKGFLTTSEGDLAPMTMKAIAEELSVHESTVARAVANKHLSCPKGIFPLKSLFTHHYVSAAGEDISAHTIKEELKKEITKEDKRHPLSDQKLSESLQSKGFNCARRTISKYRKQLEIPSASLRKSRHIF